MNLTAIKSRFLISVVANVLRAGISFSAGILVARGLSPSGYGDLSFLLGSFVAIRALLDMGSSSAFYTFLSRCARGRQFYLFYFVWMALQFAITLGLITLFIPPAAFTRIWLGHSRKIVVLAFVASFMQQQVWQMVSQIGESARKTLKVQLLNIAVAITNLTIVWLLLLYGGMSAERMLLVIIGLYVAATVLSYRFLKERSARRVEKEISYKQMLDEYWIYCKPMIGLAVASFFYAFADKWMLQKFGGAAQQGYFQIASQFAQVSLLAAASFLNIFWKEIAEATARADHSRVARLYQKTNRGLVMLSTIIAGLLLPWSVQIVAISLGPAYIGAWPVLSIMFLYPIHQSMGQVGGTMFMAIGHTKKYVALSIIMMFLSLPLSYFSMAPTSGMLIPGLGLGAVGLACYMVLFNMFGVNIQAWFIARNGGWKFDWLHQAVGIPLMLCLGFLAKTMVGLLWNLDGVGLTGLIFPMVFACFVYAIFVLAMVWLLPWLVGMEREEIQGLIGKLLRGGRRANS